MAPWNLALRFGLEVVARGVAAWAMTAEPARWVAVVAVPALAAGAWGIFNVSGDPSRSGGAPVAVRGWIRATIELVVLGGGAIGLAIADHALLAVSFAALLTLHYAASNERIRWMLGR